MSPRPWIGVRRGRATFGSCGNARGSADRPRRADRVIAGRGCQLPIGNLERSGNDLVLVAELAGHRRLETTRRYSVPSAADWQAAMDAVEIEQ